MEVTRVSFLRRSLEIFEQHGTTHSDILREQRLAGGCGLGGPLRHANSIILWLTCNQVSDSSDFSFALAAACRGGACRRSPFAELIIIIKCCRRHVKVPESYAPGLAGLCQKLPLRELGLRDAAA